jgi:hypothetical protein
VLDPLVGVRELLVEGTHDSEQRRDDGEQATRQGQVPDALAKALGTPGRHAVTVLAEQGADQRHVARARPHKGVADAQAAPHVAVGDRRADGRGGKAPSRHASASARASRRSVLTACGNGWHT